METAAHPHPRIAWPHFHPSRPARRWLIAAGFVLLAGLMTGIWFLGQNWPFRYRKIHPLLEDVFASQIHIAHYHRLYFPHPGFIATGLTLRSRSAPGQPPIGAISTLVVQSSWADLFLLRDRLRLVDATAVHIILPPPGSRAAQIDFPSGSSGGFTGPATVIEQLFIHESTLDILRDNGKRFTFPIHWLRVWNLHRGQPMKFAVDMDNALPYGHVLASGSFGPLNPQAIEKTPLWGWFTFKDVKLSDVGELRGTLRAQGSFRGQLGAIQANAHVTTPDFAVTDSHPTPIAGSIQCTINGLNGDVVYHALQALTGSSIVEATGSTTGTPGKFTRLDIVVRNGRAEDILRPFVSRPVPIAGPAALHAHAELLPTNPNWGFLDRLHVTGAFETPSEKMTDPDLRKELAAFSLRAQGHKDPDPPKAAPAPAVGAISSLQGPVTIEKGIAHSTDLRFQVPGAQARLHGTFDFDNCAVHLTGKLDTRAMLSSDTTGFKSFLLAPLDLFFKKHGHGAVIPIAVTGTPGHYNVTQDFSHKK
jgi:hypothetical protein